MRRKDEYKKMKKTVVFALALLLALSVGGCGKKESGKSTDAPGTENGMTAPEITEEQNESADRAEEPEGTEEKEPDETDDTSEDASSEEADETGNPENTPGNASEKAPDETPENTAEPPAEPTSDAAQEPVVESTPVQEPVAEPVEEPEIAVSEAYHSMTWTQGPTRYVFTHDGTKVNSYMVYMDMGSEEYAKQVLAEALANEELKNSENIKEISTTGQFVIIEYNESAFVYKTYDELKAAAELFGGVEE